MKSFVKSRLRVPLKIAQFGLMLIYLTTGITSAFSKDFWIIAPTSSAKGAVNRSSSILVRYRETGRSVLIGTRGTTRISAQLLQHLGVPDQTKPKALDFEFYRVVATSKRRSSPGQWDAGFESWTANPSTKELWLARESLSVMRTREEAGRVIYELEPTALALGMIQAQNKKVSGEDPVRAKARARRAALAQLESSWQQLLDKKYDFALVSFNGLLSRSSSDLNSEELNKARFGRALSRFHQMGCREASSDFEELQVPGPYLEDSRYYGGLCAVDRANYPLARQRFQDLLGQNSERYQDAARFYLGVVAEGEEDFASAESAYLDTIDFASDEGIIALAKERVVLLEERKALDRYSKKLVSVMATVGAGWDSNALSLPVSIRPSDYNLDTGASATYLGLGYLDIKNPWLFPLQQKFYYSYLMLGYANSDIASTSDLQSHSMGANVSWGEEVAFRHTIDVKYGLTYLGKIGSSEKYLTSYGARWDLSRATLNTQQSSLDHIWMHSFEASRQTPTEPAAEPASDSSGWLLTGSHRLSKQRGARSFGPGAEWEFKASKGTNTRYFLAGLSGLYEQPLGAESLKLKFSQEASLKGSFYYQSTASRKDYLLGATSSVSKLLTDKFEARAQLVLSKNFGAADYSYNRYQLNMMLTAFF